MTLEQALADGLTRIPARRLALLDSLPVNAALCREVFGESLFYDTVKCKAWYKKTSLLIHPDKTMHPSATKATAVLTTAHAYVLLRDVLVGPRPSTPCPQVLTQGFLLSHGLYHVRSS